MRYVRTFLPPLSAMHYLIGALIGLIITDGLMTQILVGEGFAKEANPLMQPLVDDHVFLVMQMTGRGVRHQNDHCDTYILDSQFIGLLARTHHYIPKWWVESIKKIDNLSAVKA